MLPPAAPTRSISQPEYDEAAQRLLQSPTPELSMKEAERIARTGGAPEGETFSDFMKDFMKDDKENG